MKKLCILVILCVFFYSCKQDEVQVSTKNELQSITTPQSAIAQAEQSTGQALFKKEVTFADASKKNTVTFRFAGYDEVSIDNYLQQYDIYLKPITNEYKEQIQKNAVSSKVNTENFSDNNQTKFSGIAIDFVSKNLEPTYIGYELSLTLKANQGGHSTKGRTSNDLGCHESWMNWPEYAVIETSAHPIFGRTERRWRWWWTWGFWGEGPMGAWGTYYQDVDGNWKARVCLSGQNYAGNPTVSWIDL